MAIARRLDDAATIAYALNARYAALWGPENVEERLEMADEVLELARGDGAIGRVTRAARRRASADVCSQRRPPWGAIWAAAVSRAFT